MSVRYVHCATLEIKNNTYNGRDITVLRVYKPSQNTKLYSDIAKIV